ncbi:hypothetical protein CVT25_006560 [Psilocybe cyanescens]|uniref:Uncharacterized protein n=1 Tax=Psilocybe cyanescens TaxID=93625 RepID=A0A409X444_PSICY|nr:hypothetical protein CVT25_006560 [Psilocybe cyanescens]
MEPRAAVLVFVFTSFTYFRFHLLQQLGVPASWAPIFTFKFKFKFTFTSIFSTSTSASTAPVFLTSVLTSMASTATFPAMDYRSPADAALGHAAWD